MRNYFTMPNLYKAALLSAAITLLSLGRLVHGSVLLPITLTQAVMACFLSMTLVSAAVTAWGRQGGMPGIITDRNTFLRGAGVALLLAVLMQPCLRYGLDPRLYNLLDSSGNDAALELAYPSARAGQWALLCWMAGFQTLFVCAAPMSLCARLTGNRNLAMVLCMALSVYLVHLKVADAGMTDQFLLFALPGVLGCGLACYVFSRFGLAPAMLLSGAMTWRLFLPLFGS